MIQQLLHKDFEESNEKIIERTLMFLSQVGWVNPKDNFFESLARFLSEILKMEFVCIDKLSEDTLEAETFAMYYDGKFEDNITYTLKETPCGEVVEKSVCCFKSGVKNLFKNDQFLQEMNAESYVGTTLYSSKGKPIGLIAVISRNLLENNQIAETVVKLASLRTAGEIERLQAEQELKESEEKLRELNAAKDKFISIISHDLRGPFTGIIGLSERLRTNLQRYDIEEIQTFINHINDSANQTYTLLENLLLWAKSQNGAISFKPELLDLKEVFKEVSTLLVEIANSKSITINYQLDEELFVNADKNMLTSTLRNLITNAIKYSNIYSSIDISTESNNKHLKITVSDNGIGIDKNKQEKLFKIESNISSPGTENEKGTGLGLILCKDFVEKHGGEIWVESEIEKGSKFIFTIPHLEQEYESDLKRDRSLIPIGA